MVMKIWVSACLLLIVMSASAYSDGPSVSSQTAAASAAPAYIYGKVMIQGKTPMVSGVVFLFDKSMGPPPSPEKNIYWRVPDRITAIKKNGEFSFEVNEGIYYLTAAQKDPEAKIGPPQVAELNYFHGDARGEPQPIVVASGSKRDLGVLIPSLWLPDTVDRDKSVTSIEGVVTDMKGQPVEGAQVFAYLSRNARGRPVFISDATDKNGNYMLRVHDGGSFFLRVRSVQGGGIPETGELQNVSREFESQMVTLKKYQHLKGIQLKVNSFSRGSKVNEE